VNAIGFQCYACATRQPGGFSGFTCPACGGNLEVLYDGDRVAASAFPSDRMDIFRYAALLPVRDLTLAPPLRVGRTPLYRADRLGAAAGLRHLHLKDDGLNPSASFKDRAGAVALVVALERGARVIAGATTGNAGSSMACLAASVGMPCVIFVPEKAPAAKIAQLLVFGATVLAVRGTYDEAFDLCVKVCKERGWFNRNTGLNPFTREGKKTCSFEIWEQLGNTAPDRVLVPTGDGNIISGIWKGFRDLKALGRIDRLPKLDCVQSESSAAICRAVQRTRKARGRGPVDWTRVEIEPVLSSTIADSISVDLPRDGLAAVRAVIESGGEGVTVSDADILAAIPEIARASGVFAEPAAAATWAGARKLAAERKIGAEESVVCLMTGSGLKDIARAREAAGEPHVIAATVKAADEALKKMGFA
jgi:threonine synthase